MTEEKTETTPQPQKTKSRPFYYIDGILIRLSLIVFLIALLWNWDGFWKTNIKILDNAQKTYFPVKYEAEHLKTAIIKDQAKIYQKIHDETTKYRKETEEARNAHREAENKLTQVNNKANELLRYYDTSLRIIRQLNRKFSPDELESILKCNSIECDNITNFNPAAEPEMFSFK